ncbi:competence protein CoiA family protein [Prosthecobacter sp.]|uniref:competence protein CoiA family protein n=1 Tax=Prosthecobacter sp. TaxID=1965333 RepID=UPI003783FEAC
MSRSDDGQQPYLPPSRDAREVGCSALLEGFAVHQGTGQRVHASSVNKNDGPFLCPGCLSDVIHRHPWKMRDHFAHHARLSPIDTSRESLLHYECKRRIYEALRSACPSSEWFCDTRKIQGSRETNRKTRKPDIEGWIKGRRVVIEVQKSALGIRSLIARTRDYSELGIAVLWVVPLTQELGEEIFRPRLVERYLHAMYFGRVYYWLPGMGGEVLPVHFGAATRSVSFRSNENGYWEEAGSFEKPYRIVRRPQPYRSTMPIHRMFRAGERKAFMPWGEARPVPRARLWMDIKRRWWPREETSFLKHHYPKIPGEFEEED